MFHYFGQAIVLSSNKIEIADHLLIRYEIGAQQVVFQESPSVIQFGQFVFNF